MRNRFLVSIAILIAGAAAFAYLRAGSATSHAGGDPLLSFIDNGKPGKTMRPFSSEKELKDYLRSLAERGRSNAELDTGATSNSAAQSAPASAASLAGKDSKTEESVTNTQHAGVDEGGIVKLHGDHLVILRRGRIFTVKVGDNSLMPVDAINAYAPGIDPRNDWYDEMLVSENSVVVIGYSYGRGGTEINLFDINDEGDLAYRSTYHLRSNDYYSSRNYASRLIGNKLIFYTPQYMGYGDDQQYPAIRKWHKGATDKEFQKIVQPTHVYRSELPTQSNYGMALHTVTVCDLSNKGFSCEGTSVLGPSGRVFYVSPHSVYVWTTQWDIGEGTQHQSSMLYKMPLDGSAPSALGVAGSPVDPFSFLESDDGDLNVLVRSGGNGEQMWDSEVTAGDLALLKVGQDRFSDGTESAESEDYLELPKPDGYTFQNRFVGDYFLYGTGSGWGRPEQKNSANLYAVNWKDRDISSLHLQHGVDRIEQMGKDAVIIGTNGSDLYFSPVRLSKSPVVRPSYSRKNASQGELRSHGFFYKPDTRDSGLLGLPIARQGRPGYKHLVEGSAAILFLRNDSLDLSDIGELGAVDTSTSDDCKASCVDWYGNARPLFIRNRVFALLGYELVEGRFSDSGIYEARRINYSARKRNIARYSWTD
jgi:Beta propeller domain